MRFPFAVSAGLCVGAWIAMTRYLPREENLPLHYNIYFGIDFLGHWASARLLPLAGLGLLVVNLLTGLFIWRRDRVLGYFMSFGALVVSIVVATASGLIVYLNR